MPLNVTTRGLERLDSYIDKLVNGYTSTRRMHDIVIGDSWPNGYGSSAPEEHGFAHLITEAEKALAGDGGTFVSTTYYRTIWNRQALDGRGAVGTRNHFWNDSEPGDTTLMWLTKTWTGGVAVNAWMCDGGFGGQYIKFFTGQTAWVANSQAYIQVHGGGNQYVLSNVNGISSGTEPAWPGSGFTTDNNLIWVDMGVAAGSEILYAPSTAYALNDIRRTSGGRKIKVIGGKTGATAPTWLTGVGLTVTDGSATWLYAGPALKNVPMPSGKRYRLIHKKDAAAGKVTVQFKQAIGGYPFAIDATASANEWGHVTELPDADSDAFRTMILDRTSGTFSVEGALALHESDTGLIDYRVGVNGRSLKSIDVVLAGNVERQNAFVGRGFIPNNEPVKVSFFLGINDYNAAMGSQTTIPDAQAAIQNLIKYYTAVFSDCYFTFFVPPPFVAGGAPVAGDPQYDYFQSLADAAYDAVDNGGKQANVCIVDASQITGGISAAAAVTAKFLNPDVLHPTDLLHSLIAAGYTQALGLPNPKVFGDRSVVVRSAIRLGQQYGFGVSPYCTPQTYHTGDDGPSVFLETKDCDGSPVTLSSYYTSVKVVYRRAGEAYVTKDASFINATPPDALDPVPGILIPPPPTDLSSSAGVRVRITLQFETASGGIETSPDELEWIVKT